MSKLDKYFQDATRAFRFLSRTPVDHTPPAFIHRALEMIHASCAISIDGSRTRRKTLATTATAANGGIVDLRPWLGPTWNEDDPGVMIRIWADGGNVWANTFATVAMNQTTAVATATSTQEGAVLFPIPEGSYIDLLLSPQASNLVMVTDSGGADAVYAPSSRDVGIVY